MRIVILKSLLSVLFFSFFLNVHAANIYPPIKESEIIKAGSELDYPPFCIVNKKGEADGFSVELLRSVLQTEGLGVEYTVGEWTEVKKSLETGSVRVLPLVGRTPEREDIFDFTVPYFSIKGAVYVRSGDTRIQTIEDLMDKELVELEGDNAIEYITREKITDKIFTTKTFDDAFQKLSNGEHDAIIVSTMVGDSILSKLNIKNIIKLKIPLEDFTQNFCFAVKEDDKEMLEKLNEGLSVVFANGMYEKLQNKWFPEPIEERTYSLEEIKKYGFIFLIFFIIISLIFFITVLRIQVRTKTDLLTKEVEKGNILQNILKKTNQDLEIKNNEIFQQNKKLLDEKKAREQADKNLTLSEQELREKIEELTKINKFMEGREIKMVELKNKIKELENLLTNK